MDGCTKYHKKNMRNRTKKCWLKKQAKLIIAGFIAAMVIGIEGFWKIGFVWEDGNWEPASEQWDDGNTNSGDGWAGWLLETGWTCNQVQGTASSWYGIWGDGIQVGLETWDDYNGNSGDGWSNVWEVEGGFTIENVVYIIDWYM